ncbi:MAG TPA: gamma-glutamylcyclotransferase family protein [Actinophytocola sp.]|uniref:gamma-glutamylcyclotransferase family protein n=1 Tax=Actinophytocola sp. TaxID=1872138 RepID=UPI002DDD0BD8|nr:gamma-glutamylcyclotransferase family protein [Actinophytocola sp.]HEV2781710.1 gamma-glutamylcyclotransferase family protein [Actinophytocola sp.]
MSDRLFVYGTLQPGATHWRLLEPFVSGSPRPASLPGVLYDTGRGYPALRLDSGSGPVVRGWVVELRAPSDAALSAMDEYEGVEYRRVRVTLSDGVDCWTYVWIAGFAGLRRLTEPWPHLRPSAGHDRGPRGTLGA